MSLASPFGRLAAFAIGVGALLLAATSATGTALAASGQPVLIPTTSTPPTTQKPPPPPVPTTAAPARSPSTTAAPATNRTSPAPATPPPSPASPSFAPPLQTSASALQLSVQPSGAAKVEIPPLYLALYQQFSGQCAGLPWSVLAGIGHVQSDHGRLAVHSSSGAAGPMQISPAVTAASATDGNGDDRFDANDPADAVATVERFLCAHGAADPAHLRSALLAFNDANWFAATVVSEAARYAAIPQLASAPVTGKYSLPVNPLILAANPAIMSAPHHDFPAWDLPVPTGTQVYAVTAGALEPSGGTCGNGLLLLGDDGFTYQYCHGSQVVAPGRVAAGQLIMLSGNTGASTGPHLHFGVMRDGVNLCPQPLIRAWYEGIAVSPASAPTTGCFYAS